MSTEATTTAPAVVDIPAISCPAVLLPTKADLTQMGKDLACMPGKLRAMIETQAVQLGAEAVEQLEKSQYSLNSLHQGWHYARFEPRIVQTNGAASTIIKGLALFAVLYALKDYVLGIPIACLAAIVLKLGFDILDYRILPVIQRVPIKDFIVFTITLFLTVYTDLVIAVIIGVIFALLLFFKQSITIFNFKYQHKVSPISETNFEVDNQDHQSHVSVLQPQGPLFIGSVESLINIYAKAPKHEMLIIDMSSVDMIDLSGVYALEDLIKNVKLRNIKVRLSNINPDVENVLNNMNCTLN